MGPRTHSVSEPLTLASSLISRGFSQRPARPRLDFACRLHLLQKLENSYAESSRFLQNPDIAVGADAILYSKYGTLKWPPIAFTHTSVMYLSHFFCVPRGRPRTSRRLCYKKWRKSLYVLKPCHFSSTFGLFCSIVFVQQQGLHSHLYFVYLMTRNKFCHLKKGCIALIN